MVKRFRSLPVGWVEADMLFLGAVRTVTGSMTIVRVRERDTASGGIGITEWLYLFDTGATVENPSLDRLNRLPHGYKPEQVKAVVITHPHRDHADWLPVLVKMGFRGPVFATPQTAAVLRITLPDVGRLYDREAARQTRYNQKQHKQQQAVAKRAKKSSKPRFASAMRMSEKARLRQEQARQAAPPPVLPLYTEAEANLALTLLKPVKYHRRHRIGPHVDIKFYNSDHVLGSASVLVQVGKGACRTSIQFSGDLGHHPEQVPGARHVVVESTYFNPRPKVDREAELARAVNEALVKARPDKEDSSFGHLFFLAFAIERTQIILTLLHKLMRAGRIPKTPIRVDAPLACKVTREYEKHLRPDRLKFLPAAMREEAARGVNPFRMETTSPCKKPLDTSKLKQPTIIICGAGMAEGGRAPDHLQNWLPNPQSTVFLNSFQCPNTLGRELQDLITSNRETVCVKGQLVTVRANLVHFTFFSAHGDSSVKLKWLSQMEHMPRTVFLNHGTAEGTTVMQGRIEQRFAGGCAWLCLTILLRCIRFSVDWGVAQRAATPVFLNRDCQICNSPNSHSPDDILYAVI